MKVLRQPKWTPEAALKPEKGFFLQQKRFSFTTSCIPSCMWAKLQACSWACWPGLLGGCSLLGTHCSKKNILCCKKKPFSGCRPASGLHLGCLTTSKKVFFYNIKGFFLLQCVPGWLEPQADPARGLQLGPRAGGGCKM